MRDPGRQHAFVWPGGPAWRAWAAVLSGVAWIAMGGQVQAEMPAGDEIDSASKRTEVLSGPGHSATRDPGAARGGPRLDDLLKLPSDFRTKDRAQPVAGASEDEWKRRFDRAQKAIAEAHETLAETRRELDGVAEAGGASQWSVAPPGGGADASPGPSPLSFKLRQELVRNREALESAEKALRELRIEADLAGVPAEWRVVASNPAQGSSEN